MISFSVLFLFCFLLFFFFSYELLFICMCVYVYICVYMYIYVCIYIIIIFFQYYLLTMMITFKDKLIIVKLYHQVYNFSTSIFSDHLSLMIHFFRVYIKYYHYIFFLQISEFCLCLCFC